MKDICYLCNVHLSVRQSVCSLCHCSTHWTGFRAIWFWGLLQKFCRRTPGLDILDEDLIVFHTVGCVVEEMHSCPSTTKLSVFITILTTIERESNFFRFRGNNAYANRHIVTLHINYLPSSDPPTGQIYRKERLLSFALRGVNLSFGARFIKTWILLDKKEKILT